MRRSSSDRVFAPTALKCCVRKCWVCVAVYCTRWPLSHRSVAVFWIHAPPGREGRNQGVAPGVVTRSTAILLLFSGTVRNLDWTVVLIGPSVFSMASHHIPAKTESVRTEQSVSSPSTSCPNHGKQFYSMCVRNHQQTTDDAAALCRISTPDDIEGWRKGRSIDTVRGSRC